MTREILLLLVIIVVLLIDPFVGRGIRLVGRPWFDIAHEMRGTSKKAMGRIQQRPVKRGKRR